VSYKSKKNFLVTDKHLMTGPKRNSELCFPETLNVPLGFASGNIEVECFCYTSKLKNRKKDGKNDLRDAYEDCACSRSGSQTELYNPNDTILRASALSADEKPGSNFYTKFYIVISSFEMSEFWVIEKVCIIKNFDEVNFSGFKQLVVNLKINP